MVTLGFILIVGLILYLAYKNSANNFSVKCRASPYSNRVLYFMIEEVIIATN